MASDQPWVDKHRPETWDEIQGNNTAIERIKDWASDFPDDSTPRMFAGPPGVGKTVTVEVLADWLDVEMVAINASDDRSSDAIANIAGIIQGLPADGEPRVVFLDEADSWHHAANKQPLYDALDDPANIVICSVNDQWEAPKALVRRCEVEEFKLGKRSIKAKVRKVAEAEGVDLPDEVLDSLAERPDLRSAINDLQLYAEVDEGFADAREWTISEWDMVDNLLSGASSETGQHSPRDCLPWLDENLPVDWRGLELAWGYEALARIDALLGKAQTDGYRHWRYARAILEALPELRITEPYYGDAIGRDKSFPEWFRHSSPRADGDSSEAQLYRTLSRYDEGGLGLTESFAEFRQVGLPILQALDAEAKYELILQAGLSPAEYDCLNVQPSDYEGWLEAEEPQEGDGLQTTVAADAW